MEYKGYVGSVEFSENDGVFFGKVQGVRSLISYEGTTAAELVADFHGAVEDYLALCKREGNGITKNEAENLGWSGGSLEPYAPGCSIGGGYFGNYEGLLPKKKGRKYYECDIDTRGKKSRGAKRIVFSNDGLIYYTDDHYESFTLLYGGE